jgi:hypothetical protein
VLCEVFEDCCYDLFENRENKALLIAALEQDIYGFVDVIINSKTQMMYFQAIPLHDTEYWVLVGVNREHVIAHLDLAKLRFPIFIIGVLFVISTMDSIWQRVQKIRKN